ncbi:ComEC/Rec2 family competence protein [Winogradskyella tangerina]|uniref:ComEC/Rec2 family competence protein n=1 Tax=Winogradskyella tangerina TaxID=2023240 RepID=UPI000DBE1919|nr:ComEC/Rec2 family competence protein [Winogradskyella tangerina]
MALLKFPIIKFTLCLITGIIIGHFCIIDFFASIYTSLGLILLTSLYWLILRGQLNRSLYFSVLVYLSMISLGVNAYNVHDEKLRPDHYLHLTKGDIPNKVVLKIRQRLKPDLFNHKYIATIISMDNHEVSGKVLINLKKDSIIQTMPIDAVIYASSKFQKIPNPLNPYQFDYASYLERKYVYRQLYLNSNEISIISTAPRTVYGFADQFRATINSKLNEAGFSKDVMSIINALLLGQKQSIDKEIYNNYVNSGTIHILAVSGLHVGILTLILNFLFRPLQYLKYGGLLKPTLILALLWLFAIVAGLSPSVTRAVAMFSIVTIGWHLKRPSNIYNSLAISAFFILLFKPMFLFEVGFQMSYLAVIGIVSFQPVIYKIWSPKYLIIDKLWQIFTVTLAAQIGVFPVSLYYFHQFPGLFFISNLVIIPFLGLILGIGVLTIVLALVNLLHPYLVHVFSFIINCLNEFIAFIAQFEEFLFRDIPFTLSQTFSFYITIYALWHTIKTKTFQWSLVCVIGILLFQSSFIYGKYYADENAFIVFNKSRHSIIGIQNKKHLTIHHNLDSIKLASDQIIRNFKIGTSVRSVQKDLLKSIYQFKNETIYLIDSLGIYHGLSFKPDYILLRNSPKINLTRLIDSIHPKMIIADASNFKTYVSRWKLTCTHKKIPFHYTNEKGAFILK